MLNVKVNYLFIKNFFLSILLQVNGTYPIEDIYDILNNRAEVEKDV